MMAILLSHACQKAPMGILPPPPRDIVNRESWKGTRKNWSESHKDLLI